MVRDKREFSVAIWGMQINTEIEVNRERERGGGTEAGSEKCDFQIEKCQRSKQCEK